MEEPGMGLEYKVRLLPADQRAILINLQRGTGGSAGNIDKWKAKTNQLGNIGWLMLIKML